MKKIILILFSFLLVSCSKDNPFETPTTQDQLPPASTVGANTVGCLVNGEVFLPHKNNPFGSSSITCFYQFVNGAYHFSLGFSNDQRTRLRGVDVASHNIVMQQGSTYTLISDNGNSAFGSYGDFATYQYFTSNLVTGELKITKLDQANAIISGTFWFNAISSNGEIIHITEGRFDLEYTP
jgi:hypothetical protein